MVEIVYKDLRHELNQTSIFRDTAQCSDNKYLYALQKSQVWNAQIKDGKLIRYKSDVSKILLQLLAQGRLKTVKI